MQDDLSYLAAIDRIAKLETQVAELEAELASARNEASCCDDVPLNGTLTDFISALNDVRNAERLRALTAETLLEEARRALAPFIRLADNVFSDGKNATVADEVTLWCFNDTDITFGDLRRARSTLDRIGK